LDERGYALLIQPHQYKDGAWTFVGDGVEDGETSLQTITREMLEEVGLEHFIGIEKSQNQHMFTFSAVEKQKRGLDYDGQLADIFLVRVATHSKIYDSTGRGQELLLGPTSRCQGLR
jgi:ADP-ribose pyrophosphatase YjhB (NUDIX family)